jgi:hypothetical protein
MADPVRMAISAKTDLEVLVWSEGAPVCED